MYYKSSIEALLMQFYHGVELHRGNVVTSSSEHIFEPQEGDKNIDGYVFDSKGQAWVKEWVQDYEPILLYKLPHDLPISERNGKAFIMPNKE